MAKPASGTALDSGHPLFSQLTHVWAFLEGSGTTSADSKGSNDLTLDASTSWDTSADGAVLSMATALSAPASLGTPVVFDGTQSWSIAFSAKQDADGTAGMVLGDNTNNDANIWFRSDSSKYARYTDDAGTDRTFNAAGVYPFTSLDNYLVVYDQTAGTVELYKNGASLQSLSASGTLTINTLGNGYSTSSFSLVGDISYVYIMDGYAASSTDAGNLNTNPFAIFQGSGDAVTLSSVSRVDQRSGASVVKSLSGSYSGGSADAVQCRVVLDSNSSEVVAWTDVDATLSGGTWSGSLTIPHGGPYRIQTRLHSAADAELATAPDSDTFLVGDVFLVTGQSNAIGRGTNVQTYSGSSTSWMVSESGVIADLANPWSDNNNPGDGSWGPLLANLIDASEGVPTIWIVNGSGGTRISQWNDNPPATRWSSITNQVNALSPSGIAACLWLQGESDAIDGLSESAYTTAERNLADAVATLPGSPRMIACCLAEVSGATGQEVQDINEAKISSWDGGQTEPGPWPMAIELASDNLHYKSDEELARIASLWWFSVEDYIYGGTNGRGPRIISATSGLGSSTVTLTFDKDLDPNDTTYTAATVTVDNDDGAARTVSSVTRTGTRTVDVAVSGQLDGTSPTISYGFGQSLSSGATVIKTAGVSLPATINTLSSQPLYAESFQSEPVVVASDTTPPVFSSAEIPTGGTTVNVTLTEVDSLPILPQCGITGFSLSSSGGALSVLATERTANTVVTLAVDRPVLSSETVTLSYSPGNVTDSNSNVMLGFSNQAVTNNSTQTPGGGSGDATLANQNTIISMLSGIQGSGFDSSTDSLEAIRDRGDAAWVTGGGGGGLTRIAF